MFDPSLITLSYDMNTCKSHYIPHPINLIAKECKTTTKRNK